MANTKIPAELSSTPSISDSASATAITIDSSGNVGIGGSPGAKLDVNTGTTNTLAHFHSTDDNAFIELQDDDTIGYIGVQNDFLYIGGAPSLNAQNLNIHKTTGRVGIGTTSPDVTFEIADTNAYMHIDATNHAAIFIDRASTSYHNNVFYQTADTTNWRLGQMGADDILQVRDEVNDNSNVMVWKHGGSVGVGTASPSGPFHVKSATNKTIIADSTFSSGTFTSLSFQRNGTDKWRIFQISDDSYLGFYNDATTNTQMSLHDNDDVLFHRTNQSFNNDGTVLGSSGGSYMYIERTTTGNAVIYVHRRSTDGDLIQFYQGNSFEGSISVSGNNINYGGFTGTHDSSGTGISSSTQVGTVLSTIDEEHKPDHAKVKVSNTEGDTRVYGVLQEYKAEETSDTGITSPEHAVVASVGVGSVLVTGSCNGGDLLESNGDGTAKVQDDDIIRSKTIGKVTIGNSETDVKLVSCVLYCG